MDYNEIVKKIFKIENQKKILSIFIIGSRARNEQTILKDENGIQLSDLEMIILMKSILNISRKNKKFIYNREIECEYSKSHLLFIHNLRSPLILNFKKHGKKIYGKEIRNLIQINESCEIHPFEVIELVYNSVIPFLYKMTQNQKSEPFIYSYCKVLINLEEANLILNNHPYNCSFSEILSNLISKKNHTKKDLLTIKALRFKLNQLSINEFKNLDLRELFIYLNDFMTDTKLIITNYKPRILNRILEFLHKKRIRYIFNLSLIDLYIRVQEYVRSIVENPYYYNIKKIKDFYKEWKNCRLVQEKFMITLRKTRNQKII